MIRPKLVKVGAALMLVRRRLSHYAPRPNGVPASLSSTAISNVPGAAGRAIEREAAHQSAQDLHRVCINISKIVISYAVFCLQKNVPGSHRLPQPLTEHT